MLRRGWQGVSGSPAPDLPPWRIFSDPAGMELARYHYLFHHSAHTGPFTMPQLQQICAGREKRHIDGPIDTPK